MKQTKKYGIYHWDTFDNTTFCVKESDTLEEATKIVNKKYKGTMDI